MPRTYDRWNGTFLIKEIGANAREIIFGVQLDQYPDRIVTLTLPRKNIGSFRNYFERAVRDLELHNDGNGRQPINVRMKYRV